MVHRLSILITLLAQATMSLMPACLVRCVGPNGHVCIELAGDDCHCCQPNLIDEHGDHDAAGCDRGCVNNREEGETNGNADGTASVALVDDGCGCQHTPMSSTNAVVAKGTSPIRATVLSVVSLPAWSSARSAISRAANRRCATPLLDDSDSGLWCPANVVLRV